MTTLSGANGRKVVSKATAETVGKVTDYVLDPTNQTVAAVILKKTSGDGDTLPWASIAAFGEDAVIVEDDTVITVADERLAELGAKAHTAHNKRVLTSAGVDLGAVKDVEFDPGTGRITALILKDSQIEGSRLRASGSYAVIVQA